MVHYHQTASCLIDFLIEKIYLFMSIKSQDFGPRQPADSGKVVAAKAGCG